MASALAHRLFTRGHVKYVRFHGDRSSSGNGFFARGRVSQSTVSPTMRLSIALAATNMPTRGNLHGKSTN
ncbi:hypothetical protein WN51_01767 [Melipona quadrifasciata]|uniref:Uncharacterized protein n=1 Tax=Melipona quadrifasciata TaxID=166423 RepID=A0A0M8ZXD3_9HYME|nr:hypothetical protein WN51_01767 [Melipona quadrifasciata]